MAYSLQQYQVLKKTKKETFGLVLMKAFLFSIQQPKSLKTLGLEKVDLFLMHSQLIEDDYQLFKHNEVRARNCTTLSCYFEEIIPAFERLMQEGKIDNWGIGGIGQEEAVLAALNHPAPPAAVQCVVNPLNSAGGIAYVSESFNPNRILNACQKNDVPILAIRAVQAGALTSAMDRQPHPSGFDAEDFVDFDRAAPFRQIARNPASLHKTEQGIGGQSCQVVTRWKARFYCTGRSERQQACRQAI